MGKQFPVQINKKQTLAVIETEGEVTVLSEDIVSYRNLQFFYGNKTITLSNAEGGNNMPLVVDVGVGVFLVGHPLIGRSVLIHT